MRQCGSMRLQMGFRAHVCVTCLCVSEMRSRIKEGVPTILQFVPVRTLLPQLVGREPKIFSKEIADLSPRRFFRAELSFREVGGKRETLGK